MSDKIFEITHDSLAAKIWEKVSSEERGMLEVKNFITSSLHIYQTRKVRLSRKDLGYVHPFLNKMSLTPEESQFIKKSQLFYKRQRAASVSVIVLIFLMLSVGIIYTNNAKKQSELAAQRAVIALSNRDYQEIIMLQKQATQFIEYEEFKLALKALERAKALYNNKLNVIELHGVEKLNNYFVQDSYKQEATSTELKALKMKLNGQITVCKEKLNDKKL